MLKLVYLTYKNDIQLVIDVYVDSVISANWINSVDSKQWMYCRSLKPFYYVWNRRVKPYILPMKNSCNLINSTSFKD